MSVDIKKIPSFVKLFSFHQRVPEDFFGQNRPTLLILGLYFWRYAVLASTTIS